MSMYGAGFSLKPGSAGSSELQAKPVKAHPTHLYVAAFL